MAQIVFIHGLNTYGDDDIHIGPLRFGPMHAHLERAMLERRVSFKALTGLGTGTPEDQAERAIEQIGELRDFFLLGQSTGGLVARVIAQIAAQAVTEKTKLRVRGLITIGTPHQGTFAARFGLEFGDRHPFAVRLFAVFGYDTRARGEIFRSFTPEAMEDFNRRYAPVTEETSLICETHDIAWPLQVFHRRLHPIGESGDGFIWSSSQKRGQTLGPFALDHFGELGFFPHLSPAKRHQAREEFELMCDTIAQLVSK